MQDDCEKGLIDLDLAIVFDKAEFPELVHKEIHARARRSDHFRQSLLRNFREHSVRLLLFAVAGQQKKRSSQAFFTRVEKLIDQIFFYSDVMRQHICDKMVG